MLKKIKNIIKNDYFQSLLGYVINAVLNLLTIFILARTYSKEVYAEWVLYHVITYLIDMTIKGICTIGLVKFLSGSNDFEEQKVLIGSSWVIIIGIVFFIASLNYPVFFIFKDQIYKSGFNLFFTWGPLLFLMQIPYNIAISYLQAKHQFDKINILRYIIWGAFSFFVLINFIWFKMDVKFVVIAYTLSFAMSSIYALIRNWAKIDYIKNVSISCIKKLLNYGKYGLGATICSNLLRSSDSFIIGIMLTKPDVALYSIPLRLIEGFEVILGSFYSVAFPTISKESRNNNLENVRKLFYQYTGVISLLFIPIIIGMFFFAKYLILIVGGAKYIETNASINVLRIFLIYGLFVTIDRFTGVTLDSINRPQYNFIKVLFMAVVNIIGNILAIILFKSIEAVAVVTIINVLIGVIVGVLFLKKEINIKIYNIFVYTLDFIIEFFKKKIFH